MKNSELSSKDPAVFDRGDPELSHWCAPRPQQKNSVWPAGLSRNEFGELTFYRKTLSEILEIAGHETPVFVVDLNEFESACRSYQEAFSEKFGRGGQVHYAAKAMLTLDLARIAVEAGLGLDTASAGELSLALASGCEPSLIGLHGNGKSEELLRYAVSAGIGRIILDSVSEVIRLQRVLDSLPQASQVPVMIRLTTGVHAGGHDYMATAHEDQKFGLSLHEGAVAGFSPEVMQSWGVDINDSPAMAAVKLILADERIDLVGLHSHIGSQIVDFAGFEEAARRVLEFRAQVQRQTGYLVDELDLGGGYGVAYTGADPQGFSPREVAEGLNQTIHNVCAELDQSVPYVSIEPGRSIAARSAITLYRVVNIKDQPIDNRDDGSVLYRRYVSVDGGMSDNIRPALYGAVYTAMLANRDTDAQLVPCRVVGSHCETGDVVINQVALPQDLDEGDILAVPNTGAYGWSMSSNYNWFTRLGVLGLRENNGTLDTKWLIEPETVDSMLAHFDPAYRKYLDGTATAQKN